MSATAFMWCFRLYDLFLENSFRKGRGFTSKQDLCRRLESSLNPSSLVRRVVNDLFDEGALFIEGGFVLLDKSVCQRIIETSQFYYFINSYEDDTQAVHFNRNWD